MSDRDTKAESTGSMPSAGDGLGRLSLIVERLVDADLLLPEEGSALLALIQAPRRSVAVGCRRTRRPHVRRAVPSES